MVITSKEIVVPKLVSGKMLGDYTEGDIVYLNESGSPVEFYVAKHDYESGLNGTGRTLLVRKNCYDERAWDSAYINSYANNEIDTWLNGTYKSLLDADVQSLIGETAFYYTPGSGNYTVTAFARSVFLLSVTELINAKDSYNNIEGTVLPISSVLKIAYLNGSAVGQWTRSGNISDTFCAQYVNTDGLQRTDGSGVAHGSRPCVTLPSAALFDPDANTFKGVS